MKLIYFFDPDYLSQYLYMRAKNRLNINSDSISDNINDILTIDVGNNTAELRIAGHLSQDGPDSIDKLLGISGTAYKDIIDSAKLIEKSLKPGANVSIRFDTPGGSVSGIDQAYQSLYNLNKNFNVVAYNDGRMTSAGYYLASATQKIVATSLMAETGSIGVAYQYIDDSEMLKQEGLSVKIITNTKSPQKIPDLNLPEGVKTLTEELDSAYNVFVERILQIRKGKLNKEKIDALEGRIFHARDALSLNLIDEIKLMDDNINTTVKKTVIEFPPIAGEEQKKMDWETLKKEHPALAAQIEKNLSDQFEAGRKTGLEESKTVATQATKVLQSDAYPKPIKELAIKCLTGESQLQSLTDVICVFDALVEQNKSKQAQVDSDNVGDLQIKSAPSLSQNGIVSDDNTYIAEISRMKKMLSLEV